MNKRIVVKAVVHELFWPTVDPIIYQLSVEHGIDLVIQPVRDKKYGDVEKHLKRAHEVNYTKKALRDVFKELFSEAKVSKKNNDITLKLKK